MEAKVAVSEWDEKKKKKEEWRAEIMVEFEADKITGDNARKWLEKLDNKFGPLESGPEESTNNDEEVASDDNIQLDDDFDSKAGTQTRWLIRLLGDTISVLILHSSIISASPAPGGTELPQPRWLTKSAIIVVNDSESNIEDPIVKQESKASALRGCVPVRRTVSAKDEKRAALRPISGKVCSK